MEETKVQEVDINDLVQDKRNFNKGNEQGQQLMERNKVSNEKGKLIEPPLAVCHRRTAAETTSSGISCSFGL